MIAYKATYNMKCRCLTCEISKTISKDGKTHTFDFDKDDFIEFYAKDGFENRFFPKE